MSMGGGDWERVLERWDTGRRVLNPSSTVHWGFPGGSAGKESACNAGDLGLIPELGRSPEEGMATHSSILAWKIPLDRGAWWTMVHRFAKGQAWLSN